MKKKFLDEYGIDGSLEVRFRCPDEQLDAFVMKKMDSDVKAFTSKFSNHFSNMNIDLDVRKMHIKVRGISEYECRINFVTDKGAFHATSKGIGAVNAMNDCLGNLATQIEKKRGKYPDRVQSRGQDPYMVSEFEEN